MAKSAIRPDMHEFKRAWRISFFIGIGLVLSLGAYVFLGEMLLGDTEKPDPGKLKNIGIIRTVFYVISFMVFNLTRFAAALIRRGKIPVQGFSRFSQVSRRFLMSAIFQYASAGMAGVMGLLMAILTRNRWEMYPLMSISLIFFYANWQPFSLWQRMLDHLKLDEESEPVTRSTHIKS